MFDAQGFPVEPITASEIRSGDIICEKPGRPSFVLVRDGSMAFFSGRWWDSPEALASTTFDAYTVIDLPSGSGRGWGIPMGLAHLEPDATVYRRVAGKKQEG